MESHGDTPEKLEAEGAGKLAETLSPLGVGAPSIFGDSPTQPPGTFWGIKRKRKPSASCHRPTHPETDRLEAKQLRMCLLSKRVEVLGKKSNPIETKPRTYNNTALFVGGCLISLTEHFRRHSAIGWAGCSVAGPGRVRRHAAQFCERSSTPLIGHARVALSGVLTRLLSALKLQRGLQPITCTRAALSWPLFPTHTRHAPRMGVMAPVVGSGTAKWCDLRSISTIEEAPGCRWTFEHTSETTRGEGDHSFSRRKGGSSPTRNHGRGVPGLSASVCRPSDLFVSGEALDGRAFAARHPNWRGHEDKRCFGSTRFAPCVCHSDPGHRHRLGAAAREAGPAQVPGQRHCRKRTSLAKVHAEFHQFQHGLESGVAQAIAKFKHLVTAGVEAVGAAGETWGSDAPRVSGGLGASEGTEAAIRTQATNGFVVILL